MKFGCYFHSDSSLGRKVFARAEHPWPQGQAKNADSRAMWIIQPYVSRFSKVNYLFTHGFLSSYTMINICLVGFSLPTWAEEKGSSQYRGCGPHFSFGLAAPSAPRCLKREWWAGRSRQARSIGLAVWEEAAEKGRRTTEQEKLAHLDTSGHQKGVHSHRDKWYRGLDGLSRKVCCWRSVSCGYRYLHLCYQESFSLQDVSEPKPGCWAPISLWFCTGNAHCLPVVPP